MTIEALKQSEQLFKEDQKVIVIGSNVGLRSEKLLSYCKLSFDDGDGYKHPFTSFTKRMRT